MPRHHPTSRLAPWRRLTLALAVAGTVAAQAQEPAGAPALEPIPDGAPESIHDFEPNVVVRPGAKSSTWEYRVGGRVVGMWVQPQYGVPYFLSDRDGDGFFEARRDAGRPPTVAEWRVFSW